MKKFWLRAMPEDQGAYEGLGVLPRAECFSSCAKEQVNSFHGFCSSSSRAKHEDKGACEGLGLHRGLSGSLLVSMMVLAK